MNDVLVVAEHRRGKMRDVTFEALHKARAVARENGGAVVAALLGKDCANLAGKLKDYADRVLLVDSSDFENYNAEPYLAALTGLISQHKPRLVLIAHSASGMDLAPALAIRLKAPLVTDCMDFHFDGDRLKAKRSCYGGKIEALVTVKPAPLYILTVRPGSFPAEPLQPAQGEIVPCPPPSLANLRNRTFIQYTEAEVADVDIAAADILVSVGRGIGKPENIPIAQELADALNSPLSCSRPVADQKWLSKTRQVGSSGKTVKPKIYLAIGISGAFQHQAGMRGSDTIIAINKDPRAPIFKIAHYGIVDDLFKITPVLTRKIRELV